MKQRIIYIGNKLSRHGYAPTSIETLGEKLKEDFEVLQFSDKKSFMWRIFSMWWAIIRFSRAEPVIIDTYSYMAFNYAWTCGIICHLINKPYIPIIRGGDFAHRIRKTPALVNKFIRDAKQVVVPSGFLADLIKEQNAKVQVRIIPNFIELANYPFKPRTMDDGIKILWVRAFHQVYRPLDAIEILTSLHKRGHSNARLCMVGQDKDGSLTKAKRRAEELGMNSFVEFTGRLSKPEWIKLSENFNVFLNTTSIDNTPVSVMEAMALGFPVVSSRVGGMPYMIENGKTGILLTPSDIEAFANAIEKLYSDEQVLARISRAARNKAELWDWKVVKSEWTRLLNVK